MGAEDTEVTEHEMSCLPWQQVKRIPDIHRHKQVEKSCAIGCAMQRAGQCMADSCLSPRDVQEAPSETECAISSRGIVSAGVNQACLG